MSYANFKYNLQKYAGINSDTRDMVIRGNLFVDGSANIAGLTPPDILPVSTTDIIGNILSGSYANVSGNVKAGLFIGNGAFLENLQVEVPGNITADVVGNITGNTILMSGNVTAGFLVGNASQLVGIVRSFPSTGNADIRGNVFAPGNVDTANMTTGNLAVNGNAIFFAANVAGNIATASFFYGNGILLTDVTQTFPKTAAIDIVGNVFSPGNVTANTIVANIANATTMFTDVVTTTGNVTASYFLGSGANMSNVVPSSLNTNIVGNIAASGNVYAAYFSGNAAPVQLDGYTIVPRGDVANQAARLALTNAVPGSLVYQQDIAGSYILLGTPATVDSNWLRFTGANFPVTSVMGRTGNVVFISGTDIKTIGGANIAGPGSLTSANISIFGNAGGVNLNSNTSVANVVSIGNLAAIHMTAIGNITADYLVGDGSLLESLQLTFPSSGSIDIQGNVLAPGNVDAENVSMVTANVGNITIANTLTSSGNVTGAWFVGNGLYITGIPATGTQPVNITGNVVATANVDAANSSTTDLNANTITVTGNVTIVGNVTALGFVGDGSRLFDLPASVSGTTQNVNIVGNVVATGNVDVGSNLTSNTALVTTVTVSGQVNTIGNVTGWYLSGDGSRLTGAVASLGGTQNLDISGNVRSQGNISAANVTARIVRTSEANVSGNLISIGNIVSSSFFIGSGSGLFNVTTVATGDQNVNIIGNVAASANVDASNVTTGILRVAGNVLVLGQTNSVGNVVAPFFIGNGLGLSNLVVSNAQFVNIVGNVTSAGNVNANNITTGIVSVGRSLVATSQVNVTGNVVAQGFSGDGSLLEGITFSATSSPTPSFVPPTTGFVSNVANTILYSNTAGWTIQIQQYTTTGVGITTYSMPTNPDAPFINLPSGVTQTLANPWTFSNGVWTGNVVLFSTTTFGARPISMGYNSAYGILGGNSSVTNGTGVQQVSVNGALSLSTSLVSDMWPNPDTGNIWMIVIYSGPTMFFGQTFVNGQVYFMEFSKNLDYLISSHRISQNADSQTYLLINGLRSVPYFVSTTEVYLLFGLNNSGYDPIIYDKTGVRSNNSYAGLFMARINPTDRTCQWITSVTNNQSPQWFIPSLSVNPQRTLIHVQSELGMSTPIISSLFIGNTSGNAITFPSFTSASVRRIQFGFGLFPGNGNYVSNTLYGGFASSLDTNDIMRRLTNSDIWSADGQVAYTCLSYLGTISFTMNTWNPTSNTWTLRNTLTPQGTFAAFTCQPFVYRLPIGNVGSPWTSVAMTTTRDNADGYARQPQIASITPANNGNVFLFGLSPASNTAIAATTTFGNASTTVGAGVAYNPPQVFRFQDTNGTFSNYGASTGTSTTGGSQTMGVLNNWQGFTSVKVPGSNTSVRVMTSTNFTPDLVLNGVSMANVSSNVNFTPAIFDINSSMGISNFRNQLPATAGRVNAFFLSPTVFFAPAADLAYNSVGAQAFGSLKMGNV